MDNKCGSLVNDALTAVCDAYVEKFFKTAFGYSARDETKDKAILRD